jgi:hypothetical protein
VVAEAAHGFDGIDVSEPPVAAADEPAVVGPQVQVVIPIRHRTPAVAGAEIEM